MARPKCCRRVGSAFEACGFRPSEGDAANGEVILRVDELEAIRLADLEGLYQADAAERMQVSRQTFGRILVSGHRKVASALVEGRALRVAPPDGSVVEAPSPASPHCGRCGHAHAGAGCCGRRRRSADADRPTEGAEEKAR
ncbi:MAG TPA: DUF134 domain-containing protein [Armatimonadota bacterium]|jgi:predicted DNA-binding protein (UPF0251 family)